MRKDTNMKSLGSLLRIKENLKNKYKQVTMKYFINVILLIICCLLFVMGSPIEHYFSNEKTIEEKYEEIERLTDSLAVNLHLLEEREMHIFALILKTDPYPVTTIESFIGMKGNLENRLIDKKIDTLFKYLNIRKESYDEMVLSINDRFDIIESIPFMYPIYEGKSFHISSTYGLRMDPIDSVPLFHCGYDFVSLHGTFIVATGEGRIVFSGNSWGGFGHMIRIGHGYGYETVYAHLDEIYVKAGEKVKRGQIIGTMGNTGRSTGTHLHYEIRKGGYPVNPQPYLNSFVNPEQYDMLVFNDK